LHRRSFLEAKLGEIVAIRFSWASRHVGVCLAIVVSRESEVERGVGKVEVSGEGERGGSCGAQERKEVKARVPLVEFKAPTEPQDIVAPTARICGPAG
jgi:hypothetical protein